ncbi:MAG: heavy-metal-associated domain-containing protein, partial [Egibacteraceae bacterium]
TQDVISVPEIHCGHCKESIEGALQPMPGVQTATVDIPAATVAVTYDPELVTRTDIVTTIVEQGFEVPA